VAAFAVKPIVCFPQNAVGGDTRFRFLCDKFRDKRIFSIHIFPTPKGMTQ
jgi:hypothetical protein